ncbi:MAG: hypothetical protein IT285_09885 [Bdellovibrionales bacterium]|nr:hypothetical protein [Bdellovibrionales bacterium]
MKQHSIQQVIEAQPRNEALGPEEAALFEQLALRRLRQVAWRHRRRRAGAWVLRAARSAFRWGAALAGALFGGAELVQQIAPGQRPLARRDWEKPELRRPPTLF